MGQSSPVPHGRQLTVASLSRRYSPDELRYLPLNTALYEPPLDPELPALDSDGDSDDAEDGRGDEKRKHKGTSVGVLVFTRRCPLPLEGVLSAFPDVEWNVYHQPLFEKGQLHVIS